MPTYIIRAGLAGPVKIGRADDVEQRRASLQTAQHEELHILRVVDTPFDCENAFHEHFVHRRIRGEWFEFDPEMLTYIPKAPVGTARATLAMHLRRVGINEIVRRIGVTRRTVENWITGRSGPQCRHMVAMLNDGVLAPVVLKTSGRDELVNSRKTIEDLARQVFAKHGADHPVFQRPELHALKAALVSEGK